LPRLSRHVLLFRQIDLTPSPWLAIVIGPSSSLKCQFVVVAVAVVAVAVVAAVVAVAHGTQWVLHIDGAMASPLLNVNNRRLQSTLLAMLLP